MSVRTRVRGPAFGLAGQLLNATTNVATAFVASYLLTPDDFGRFVLAYAAVTIALATGRGLIGSTMLTHLPAVEESRRPGLVGSALGFTVWAGLSVTAALGVTALFVPTLGWFVPWVLVALFQDAGRHVFLAQARTGSALLLDVAWALAQIAVFVVWLLVGATVTLGVVAGAWGAGALAGSIAFVLMSGHLPRRPGPWMRTTRDIAGWFTATAVIGQCEVYIVLLLTGALLTTTDAGGLRAVQLIVLQPALVVLGSILILATPMFARLPAHSPPAALARASSRTLLAVAPVVALFLLVVPVREPLMSLVLPQYLAFESLVLPTALQVAVFAACVPAMALLRGRRRGSSVFGFQVLRIVLIVGCTLVGLYGFGILGVAWAQVIASAVSLIGLLLLTYRTKNASTIGVRT